MKKKAVIIIAILILGILFTGVSAAEETTDLNYEYAVKLREIGLFRGTGNGFELERAPTRLEGAVMFVRLLGGEPEAAAMGYSHPFTDVPTWGDPYVGYLYEHELTNGISDSEFGSYLPMRAISYMTFVLRALGYSDEGVYPDFEWNRSLMFSYNNGILDLDFYSQLTTDDFLRGHVARLSYESLKANLQSGDEKLIDRLISGGVVEYDDAEAIGLITPDNGTAPIIAIGYSDNYVLSSLGNPDFVHLSRYGFIWHIYENDYTNYLQVGVEYGKIVSLLSASNGYSYEKNISVGMRKSDLEQVYPEGPVSEYRKPVPDENKVYVYTLDNENKSTYRTSGGNFITYYFDSYENDIITAWLVIDEAIEIRTIESFNNAGTTIYESIERQTFGITNAIRVQKELSVLGWDNAAREAAVLHSKDMAERHYFSHYTPEGEGFGERLEDSGVDYRSAGENIAYGYRNPIHMVNDWMNSQTGHREVMLGDFSYLGVGVWIDYENRMFGTQEFWR